MFPPGCPTLIACIETTSDTLHSSGRAQKHISSRLTPTIHFFLDALSVQSDRVQHENRKFLGSSEEVIRFKPISQMCMQSGLLFTQRILDKASGSQPIVIGLPPILVPSASSRFATMHRLIVQFFLCADHRCHTLGCCNL
jgi:hypothetical protein